MSSPPNACKKASYIFIKWWHIVLKQLKLVVLSYLYLIVLPILTISAIPVYLFRLFASQAKKVLRPDLAELVHSRSSVLAVDGFPDKPTWNLVVWLTMEGILDLDKFAEDFYEEYVLKRDDDKGQALAYPEYQQHLEKWWGFHFWKWDFNFDIRNHIRRYDGKYKDEDVISDQMLLQIVKEQTWKGWNPNRSPWEFLQIPNYKGEGDEIQKSILIFRIHHVLGDGYYILKLIMEDIAGISIAKAAQPKYVEQSKNWFIRIFDRIWFWVRAPYQFVEMLSEAKDTNPWHIPEEKLTRPMNLAITPMIPLKYIKDIRNLYGVTFTAVINAAVTGGIRNTMLELGIVAENIHQAVAVPLPEHPPKLRNHFIFSFIKLPVGTSDPIKRLYKLESTLQKQRHSSVTLLNFLKVPLVGALFPALMGPFTINRLTTCLMSNFPGTPEVYSFKGHNVVDMMFGAGLGPGNTGLGFTLISCSEHIRLLSAADPSILNSDEMVEKLNQNILKELSILEELGTGHGKADVVNHEHSE